MSRSAALDDQPFTILAQQIAKVPLLTREEEIDIGRKAYGGDLEARNKLIEANLRFVFQIAKKFRAHGRAEYEGIVSSGLEGLTHAAERFNPDFRKPGATKGNRFTTYARFWIEHCIKRYLNIMVPSMHVPTGQIQDVRSLHRDLIKSYQRYQDHNLTEERLAEIRGKSASIIQRIMAVKKAFSVVSYDSDEGQVYLNQAAQKEAEEQQAVSLPTNIAVAMEQLPDVHRDIIQRYFGIHCHPQTLQDISMIYILSRERIRQIKDEALNKIREQLDGEYN